MPEGDVRRGSVFLLNLSSHGGGLRKERPVLVVQNDVGNRFSSETIVIAIRDPHGGRQLPVFVPLSGGTGGLTKDSVADAGHVYTIPQDALGRRLGALAAPKMHEVDQALRRSLGLS